MKWKEFFRDESGRILPHFISIIMLSIFLRITGTASGIILIIIIVWGIVLVITILSKWIHLSAYTNELEAIMNGLDKKYLFMECIPKPKKSFERHLFALMKQSGKSMIEEVSNAREEQKEYQEYIENWVHEIKAPITTTRLLLNRYESEESLKILKQLIRMEEHVERVLFYARAGSVEKDFVIRATPLTEIVTEVIGKYQQLLIQNNVRIQTTNLELVVYTDGKWVSFMIGQLLSNAVRYRSEHPIIQIEAHHEEGKVRLNIADNGIGIPSHDLPRLFERGFTGDNGRERGSSTGMGLYICKRLADTLQIELNITSEKDTKISLLFPSKENLTKM